MNDGNIPTVTFTNTKYTSDYVKFDAWETSDREHKPLQTLHPDVDALLSRSTTPGRHPVDVLWHARMSGSGIPLEPLLAHTGDNGWNEIVGQMQTGTGDVGASINANANMISAQVCELTGGQPANVYTRPGVTAAAALVKK